MTPTSVTIPAQPHTTAKLAAILSDGRFIDLVVKNFGWDGENYVTRFEFDAMAVESKFRTHFHQEQFCSEPDVRFLDDLEILGEAMQRQYGAQLVDIEV